MFSRFVKLSAQPVFRYATALFIFSLAVNLVCFNWAEAPVIYPDSHGYIKPAEQLKQGQLPDFSLRSPTYPMYLFVMSLLGQIINRSPLKLAVCGQIVFGAVTIVLLYFICLRLLKKEWLALGVSALLGLNFQVINYQATVLTETLATTLLMAVLYAHIASVGQRLTLKRLVGLVIVDSLLVMLRPNFVLLPTSLYALHVLYLFATSRTTAGRLNSASSPLFALVLGVSCNLALVATWGTFYYLRTGHLGLSRTAEFNMLGKAIQYGYLDHDYAYPPRMAERAQGIYYEEGRPLDPYIVINRLRSEKLYTLQNLKNINSYFLTGHNVDFVVKTVQLMPEVLNMRPKHYYGWPKVSSQTSWIHHVAKGFNRFHTLNSKVFVFAWALALYLWIKRKTDQFMALVMILATVFYHLVAITAFGYSEYSRLRVPVDLLLNLLVLLPFLCLAAYVDRRLKFQRWKLGGGSTLSQSGHEALSR